MPSNRFRGGGRILTLNKQQVKAALDALIDQGAEACMKKLQEFHPGSTYQHTANTIEYLRLVRIMEKR